MGNNFVIVLFKNRKKRRIIKRYDTEKRAIEKFNCLLDENKTIVFEKTIENADDCVYEIGLITNQKKTQDTIFFIDNLGRNLTVNLENPDYVFLKIEKYKIEELIYDWQNSEKISFTQFIKNYCKNFDLKNIFTLNNKICVQINEDVQIFSLKNSDESYRFINLLEEYFYENRRSDAIFVRDISNPQRKWLYEILSKKGFDKRKLYRLKTTFSKR